MFTLTKASKETKLILKWAAIVAAFLLILFLIFRTFVILHDIFFPTPPPKPTVKFGKLPSLSISQNQNTNTKFSLDTISGTFPNFDTQAKVYKIISYSPDLQALKTIGDRVAATGFVNGPFKYSDKLYFWTDSSGQFLKTIRVNIVSNDFTLFSLFYYNQAVLSSINLPDEKQALSKAQNFLDQMGYLTDDFDLSKTTAQLLSINNGQLYPTNSLSLAQAIRVNFYQKDLDGLPIVYAKPNESNVNLIITGGDNNSQVVRGTYILKQPSSASSTYPIKTAKEAFGDLEKGNALIVNSDSSSTIKINNIYLAYFVGDKDENYIYPVIVFEGKNFQAYVSAVKDEWISK